MNKLSTSLLTIFILVTVTFTSSAIQNNTKNDNLQGTIEITGSSTLYPLTNAVANFFEKMNPGVTVNVKATGTVKGFSLFIDGKSDITNASRSIMPSEIQKLSDQNIRFYELPVTYGAITLIRNKENEFANDLTIEEIKQIFMKDSPIKKWSDLRSDWPDEKIIVTGPKSTHGTYDFLQSKILGKDEPFRQDYDSFQEYKDVLNKVEDNLYAIGYIGLANYTNHETEIRTIALRFGNDVVEPSFINVKHGNYKVLSRKMYLYVNANRTSKPAVNKFLEVYLSSAKLYASKIGLIPFSEQHYQKLWEKIQNGETGLFTESESSEVSSRR